MQPGANRSGPADWCPDGQERYPGAEKGVLEQAVSVPMWKPQK